MAINATPASNLRSVPAPTKEALASNYVDFTSSATLGWGQQYVPDIMEKEAEGFGNRTISGFLERVGAEEPMTADRVVWSEQGRLHLAYAVTHMASNDADGLFTVTADSDGNAISGTPEHAIRVGDLVLISDANSTARGIVTKSPGDPTAANQCAATKFEAKCIDDDTFVNAGIADAAGATCLVYGSEYVKGDTGRGESVDPGFKSFENKPIIIKDKFDVSGSDASAIGWIEVSGEDGQNGYLWYLKGEGDTRQRFTDYLEMTMIESGKKASDSTAAVDGTEGLWAAMDDRGNYSTGVLGSSASTDLTEFDAILAEFDKNGAIEENMMYVNRTTALAVDDMLAGLNPHVSGGVSYGVFDNAENMALNLGFNGFRRGSYDFYKTDWKYLNDYGTRGALNDVGAKRKRGIIVPAGVSSVYDEALGKAIKRPFLHVRYRASAADDRRFKTWTTGSVGSNITSDLDALEVHYLSERCLIVQGANNFMALTA